MRVPPLFRGGGLSVETRTIVGVTGAFGSGCSTVAQMLHKHGYYVFRVSDILQKEAQNLDIRVDRQVAERRRLLQMVGSQLRSSKGGGILVRMALEQALKEAGDRSVVLDSIKNPEEIEYLRQQDSAFTVAIDASDDTRWGRVVSEYQRQMRLFRRDSGVDRAEGMESGQNVQQCVDMADIILDNDYDWTTDDDPAKSEFESRVLEYARLMEEPDYRKPTVPETLMHEAYEASLESRCMSRKVGAVVVAQETPESSVSVLARGFNHVPEGSRECVDVWGECARRRARRRSLADLRHCPSCGSKLHDGSCIEQDCIYWTEHGDILELSCPGRGLDICRALHAEEDAILQAAMRSGSSTDGCNMYVTTFPCPWCAKTIVESGVGSIVYAEAYPMVEAERILEDGGVETTRFEGVKGPGFNRLFPGQ